MQSLSENHLYKNLVISAIRQEAKDFITIEFAEDESNTIHYKAGQYLTLVKQWNGKEERRSYSITSSPILSEPLSIGVKRIENGLFSRFLYDTLQPGDKLITTGAAGLFVLPENINVYQQVYLFAAGSGITPIYSLLKTILHAHPYLNVVLVYSNHSKESAAFLQSLEEYQQKLKGRFTIHFLFSIHKNIYKARLHRDLLNEILNKNNRASKDKTLAYVCGPKNYRRMCIYGLQDAGFQDENIRKEVFEITEPLMSMSPPDTSTHIAHIHYAGMVHHIKVEYPYSILKAAKKSGIQLPYSCEAGTCGSCAMRCISGNVWMSYNEVLTQKDIGNGIVLTCTGHPVFGDVELHSY